MNSTDRGFRERLLGMEQATPALKERYDKEIHAMLEERLTGVGRRSWLGWAVMGIGFAVLFGTMAVIPPEEFPLFARVGFAVGALFGVGWAILAIRVFRRGSFDLRKDTFALVAWAGVFVIFTATLFLVFAPESISGLRMMVSSLVYLVGGVAFLLWMVVQQAELNIREKLLEIEYRLAELAEAVNQQKWPQPTGE